MALLSITDLCFKYDDDVILENLQLELQEGEIVALLGPNGCGKTTLLDCIIGYKQIDNGSIRMNGEDVKAYSVREKARHIAYVPQSASSIFPFSVMQMVLMGRTPHLGNTASPSKKDMAVALDAMEALGIGKFSERVFSSLSGGEKQLVLIARALAQDARIILLDEPTSSLDLKNETMVLGRIKKLVSIRNKSLIIATHQPNHVYYLEQGNVNIRAALFADRTIKYLGTPAEVINEQTIQDVCAVTYTNTRTTTKRLS